MLLTPLSASVLFVAAVLAGHRYRQIWKKEGPRWQLWIFGAISAACFCILAFTPFSGA